MSVDFIGMIGHRRYSEIHPPEGPVVDIDYIDRFARAHEAGGFDRVLIGYFSNAPGRIPDRGTRRLRHRAARADAGASAGLRRTHPGGAQARDARPAQRRPGRGAHHLGRRRRRPAQGRRLSRPRRALCPDRRISRGAEEDLDRRAAGRATTASYYTLRAGFRRRQAAAAAAHPDLFRWVVGGGGAGRRQARRHLRTVGRDPRPGARDHCSRARCGSTARPEGALQPVAPADPGRH